MAQRAALIANTFGRKLRAVVSGDARRELRTQIADAEREVDDLQARVNDLDAQLALGPANAALLTAQRDALVNQYRIAYDELQALRTSTTDGEPVVTLEAAVPQRAAEGLSAPKSRPARMALFGLLGLLLGAALALILDRVDTRIRTKEDAEAVSGLPVLTADPVPAPPSPARAHQRQPPGITVRRGVPQPALHARLRPGPALRLARRWQRRR